MNRPVCTIIAGPNGSGKTTFALKYLSGVAHCQRFINADLIASGLSPLSPELEQMAASKLFLNEIREAIERREDFAFETTLSGRTNLKRIQFLRENKWRVELIYLYLPDVEMSVERVAERVRHGGHNIPLQSILRRYSRSLQNLFELYLPLCDSTICMDNSSETPKLIFSQTPEGLMVEDTSIYQKLLSGAKR